MAGTVDMVEEVMVAITPPSPPVKTVYNALRNQRQVVAIDPSDLDTFFLIETTMSKKAHARISWVPVVLTGRADKAEMRKASSASAVRMIDGKPEQFQRPTSRGEVGANGVCTRSSIWHVL
ncbi:MAG: hypothetical protein ACTS6J_21660 [Burkholderiales bacterium]